MGTYGENRKLSGLNGTVWEALARRSPISEHVLRALNAGQADLGPEFKPLQPIRSISRDKNRDGQAFRLTTRIKQAYRGFAWVTQVIFQITKKTMDSKSSCALTAVDAGGRALETTNEQDSIRYTG